MKTRSKIWPALSLTLLSAALLGCGQPSPDQLIVSAQQLLSKGDPRAALVELKAAAAARPDHAETRFLLGRALLELDEPVTAIVELTKAEQAGHPAAAVTPEVARALLAQRDYQKVLGLCQTADLKDSQGAADCLASTAAAHAALGDPTRSLEDVSSALKLSPGYAPADVIKARVLAAQGDLQGAMQVIDSVLTTAPNLADALLVKGDILGMSKADSAEVLALYRRAIELKPLNAAAHGRVLSRLLGQNDIAGAKAALNTLNGVLPASATNRYFQARVALAERNVTAAESLVQQLLKAAPSHPDVLTLAGVIALEQGSALRAEAHLSKALLAAPHDALLKRLLARAHVAAGSGEKALDLLRPEIAGNAPTKDALAIAATAHFQAGNPARAQEFLERAAKLDPDAADIKTRLALAKALAAGGRSASLAELEALAGQQDGLMAALALVPIQVNRGNFEGALKAIDRVAAQEPGKPRAETLRAQVLALKGDTDGARKALESARKLDPTDFAAASGLAALDAREGRYDVAADRFRAILDAQPKNVRALQAIAELAARSGKPTLDTAKLFEDAIAADPRQVEPRRALVEFYLSRRNPRLALEAAQAANTAMPDRPEVLDLLGRAQLMAGEATQAISTFGRLTALLPQAVQPLLRLVDANLAGGRQDAARTTAQRAAALAPTDPEVIRKRLLVEMQSGRWQEARQMAADTQRTMPNRALGYEGAGDVERAQGRWASAATYYEAAIKKEPGTALAQKLHLALLQAGKRAAAQAWADEWIKTHPADSRFMGHLGAQALSDKDYTGAEARLSHAVKLDPSDAIALNNLAWSLGRLKKAGGLEYAERANRLRPDDPVILDTLATLLAQDRKFSRAIDIQKRAIEMQPRQPRLQLGLARILISAGERSTARDELDSLLEKTTDDALVKEIQSLRATL